MPKTNLLILPTGMFSSKEMRILMVGLDAAGKVSRFKHAYLIDSSVFLVPFLAEIDPSCLFQC